MGSMVALPIRAYHLKSLEVYKSSASRAIWLSIVLYLWILSSLMVLYLLVQLPHQTIFTLWAFLCPCGCSCLSSLYCVPWLQVYFDLSYPKIPWNITIGILWAYLRLPVLLGSALLVGVGYIICLPCFFVGIGMWHFFISDMLEPIYESIHENWRQNRMKQFYFLCSYSL